MKVPPVQQEFEQLAALRAPRRPDQTLSVAGAADLADAAEGRFPEAFVKAFNARVDARVVLVEQRIAVEIALDYERTEVANLEYPHRLLQSQLVGPKDVDDLSDAAAQQGPGTVAYGVR